MSSHRLRVPPQATGSLDISFAGDMLSKLQIFFDQYGDAFRVYSPATHGLIHVFSHPEHARHVLLTNHRNYTKGIGLERVGMLLGNGIMVSEGELWRRQRKMIQPAFHRDVIERLFADIRNANLDLLEEWTKCARNGRHINLTRDISDVTLRIVLRAIFSADLDSMGGSDGTNPFALLTEDPERNLGFAYRFRALSRPIMDCIALRRRQSTERYDLLSMLMSARDRKSGEPMSDRQLMDEVMTLVVAGHETTASALNWMWYLLSQHPSEEIKLHKEIDAQTPPASLGDTARLPYTRQLIEETLRLYPPGWLLTRRSIGEDMIGGYRIAPNTDVFLSPYILHRHPRFWYEPGRFDPERFEPQQIAQRNRFVYLPFALGPRACIGEQFAMLEMILHTAILARHVRLRPIPGQPVEPVCQVNLRMKHNLYMQPQIRCL